MWGNTNRQNQESWRNTEIPGAKAIGKSCSLHFNQLTTANHRWPKITAIGNHSSASINSASLHFLTEQNAKATDRLILQQVWMLSSSISNYNLLVINCGPNCYCISAPSCHRYPHRHCHLHDVGVGHSGVPYVRGGEKRFREGKSTKRCNHGAVEIRQFSMSATFENLVAEPHRHVPLQSSASSPVCSMMWRKVEMKSPLASSLLHKYLN